MVEQSLSQGSVSRDAINRVCTRVKGKDALIASVQELVFILSHTALASQELEKVHFEFSPISPVG